VPQVDRSVAQAPVVLGQPVPGEVAAQVAPYRVDVIGPVLDVVVLDEQAWTAERVIVAGAAFDRPGPAESPSYPIGVGSADRQAAPASLGTFDGNEPSDRPLYPQVVAHGDGSVLRLA
jgi:hypothetical protein